MVVRPRPDLSVAGKSIDFAPQVSFPYWVTKTSGEWMYIQPMAGGPAGWVRARVRDTPEEWSLERWLPELAFVDAINGFMRLRSTPGVNDADRVRISAAMDTALRRFASTVPADEAPVAHSLGAAMRGFVAWNEGPAREQRQKASELFDEAARRTPDFSEARNLAAVTRPFRTEESLNSEAAARLERELIAALAIDPANRNVLDNLDSVYKLFASRSDWSLFAAEELASRRAVVSAAQKRGQAPLW
jgi:hypothetical protein